MKYPLLLLILSAALLLVYWRLRPYIAAARRFLGVVRDVRSVGANEPLPRNSTRAPAARERLVRCAACGTWLPASRSLSRGRSAGVYCSPTCLEAAAAGPRP